MLNMSLILIGLVALYYSHRFVWKMAFRCGKYQEQMDRLPDYETYREIFKEDK